MNPAAIVQSNNCKMKPLDRKESDGVFPVNKVTNVSPEKVMRLISVITDLHKDIDKNKITIHKLTDDLDRLLNQQEVDSKTSKPSNALPQATLPTQTLAQIRQFDGIQGLKTLVKYQENNNRDQVAPPPPPPMPIPEKSMTKVSALSTGKDELFAQIRKFGGTQGLKTLVKYQENNNRDQVAPPPPPPMPIPEKSLSKVSSSNTSKNELFAQIRKFGGTQGLKKSIQSEKITQSKSSDSELSPGKKLILEQPDKILSQYSSLSNSDRDMVTGFISDAIIQSIELDILAKINEHIGSLPANNVTQADIDNMPDYCRAYFNIIKPYTQDTENSPLFSHSIFKKSDIVANSHQPIKISEEMQLSNKESNIESPSRWLTVSEGLNKMQKQPSLTSRKRYNDGSVASTREKTSEIFSKAQKASIALINDSTRTELLSNDYQRQVTSSFRNIDIFNGFFSDLDKTAARKLEHEFSKAIKNPEKLQESIKSFLKQRLPTGFSEFTYQSISAENERLKAELAQLKLAHKK
ncbi:hypothetical protein [Vibrio sp. 11986-1-5]|uniref:hypothetical protein n=1 Tax=Vibrio sp. 11986-1-5 TaxID=2211215 RepID=UPI000D73A94E|nr:hypothetical protein [Vibrio sp. 11986-1-5]PXA73452.1 hypothetical protein DMC15_05190 [Vibrio sp. 11986-1-5]